MKKFFIVCYWTALAALAGYCVYNLIIGGFPMLFHAGAYYAPIAGIFLIFSGQMDLLEKIREGNEVNIKARALDFVHWFLFIFMDVGRWMMGGITMWTFLLKVILLAIIGWQIGIGIGRHWFPSVREKTVGALMLFLAALLGSVAGIVRYIDKSTFGWGWGLETVTAILGTCVVVWWISQDLRTIKQKADGYPRSFFHKGIFNNLFSIWVLVHLIIITPGTIGQSWLSNAGVAIGVIIGNLIFFIYYFTWEYYIRKQTERTNGILKEI